MWGRSYGRISHCAPSGVSRTSIFRSARRSRIMSDKSKRLSARTRIRRSSNTCTNGLKTSRGSRRPPVAAPARRVIMLRNTARALSASSLCSVSADQPAIASSSSSAARAAASASPFSSAAAKSEFKRSVAWRRLLSRHDNPSNRVTELQRWRTVAQKPRQGKTARTLRFRSRRAACT